MISLVLPVWPLNKEIPARRKNNTVSDMFAWCRFCVGYYQLTTNDTVEKSARIHIFSVKVVLETDVGISLDNPRNVLPDWNISSSVFPLSLSCSLDFY